MENEKCSRTYNEMSHYPNVFSSSSLDFIIIIIDSFEYSCHKYVQVFHSASEKHFYHTTDFWMLNSEPKIA